jgi:hypothetical protein
MTSDTSPPKFVSVNDAAKLLGRDKWFVYRLIKAGDIDAQPYMKRRLAVDVESVLAYADTMPTALDDGVA